MSEFPEAELVKKTVILRQMDLPPNIKLTKRSMLRWFALSIGLISEKESRSTVLDVVDAVFSLQLGSDAKPCSTTDVQDFIKLKYNKQISEKLLRYHLNRMIDLGLLLRKKQKYVFNYAPYAEKNELRKAFNHHITSNIHKTLNDVEDVFEQLTESYKK
ncbi:MAG: hypothetical protein Q7S21_06045 [archaeon]|nr:hypothetical protein [archaeon]